MASLGGRTISEKGGFVSPVKTIRYVFIAIAPVLYLGSIFPREIVRVPSGHNQVSLGSTQRRLTMRHLQMLIALATRNFNELAGKTIRQTQSQRRKSL